MEGCLRAQPDRRDADARVQIATRPPDYMRPSASVRVRLSMAEFGAQWLHGWRASERASERRAAHVARSFCSWGNAKLPRYISNKHMRLAGAIKLPKKRQVRPHEL